MMRRAWTLVAAGMVAASLAAQTSPKKPAAYTADPRPWEHESSDLPADPRMHFGACANGLRYAWVQNNHPPKQVLLRLHVAIGSLAEKGDELGLAHFLEHMAFNGSKSFKAGTLVPTFQSQGIRFGSDVNAHTAFDETVYELDLPDAEPQRLEKALLWFRDVIDGLKLEPAEIDAEKGVIDAEQDSSDHPGQHAWHDRVRALLDGSRYPRRIIIGEKAVRAKFDRKICAGFWDRWYRPENMTFMVVGDLGQLDLAPWIDKSLGQARGRGERQEPPGKDLDRLTFTNALFTQGLGGGEIALYVGKVRAKADEPDDSRTRAAALAVRVACDVLEARLNDLAPRPFVLASVGSGESFHPASEVLFEPVLDGISLRLATDLDHWRTAVQYAEREVRRFLESGISDDELKAALTRLDQSLVAEPIVPPTRNEQFLDELLRACNERVVPMEEKAEKELVRKAARALDKAGCLRAFEREWEKGKLLIWGLGGLDLKDAAREMLDDAWKEAAATRLDVRLPFRDDLSVRAPKSEKPAAAPTAAGEGSKEGATEPAKPAAAPFPYALPDQIAETSERTTFAEIGAARLVFKNGVRAHLKAIPGQQGRFSFEVRVGEGTFALDPAQADLAKVASSLFLDCGTGKCPIAAIRDALSSANATVGFEVEGDACVFSGSSTGAGGDAALRRALEVVCAYLTDPAWTAKPFDDFKKHLGDRGLDGDLPYFGLLRAAFERELENGDPRLLPLDRAAAAKLTFDDVKNFLAGQLDGPIEVTIVGDVFLDRQIQQVESTLGQLALRRAAKAFPESRRSVAAPKTGLRASRGAVDLSGKDSILRIVYPGPDAIDVGSERLLELLGDVVDDRLRADIREKLGSTYSPDGGAWGDPCYRGRGFVEIDLMVEPGKLKATIEACLASMENLAKAGAKKEEFERLRAARIGNPEALARNFGFWLRELRRAQRAPALLDELKELRRWYDRVTLADLNALAKQLLGRDRACVLDVSPR